jgi:hypothetical protein
LIAVLAAIIEIEIERKRMCDDEIVRLITRAHVCAVRDKAGKNKHDEREEADSPFTPLASCGEERQVLRTDVGEVSDCGDRPGRSRSTSSATPAP